MSLNSFFISAQQPRVTAPLIYILIAQRLKFIPLLFIRCTVESFLLRHTQTTDIEVSETLCLLEIKLKLLLSAEITSLSAVIINVALILESCFVQQSLCIRRAAAMVSIYMPRCDCCCSRVVEGDVFRLCKCHHVHFFTILQERFLISFLFFLERISSISVRTSARI